MDNHIRKEPGRHFEDQVMNIYEAIGGFFVVLMVCVGIYTIGRLVVEGIKCTATRIEIGSRYEDAVMRDHLAVRDEIRRAR